MHSDDNSNIYDNNGVYGVDYDDNKYSNNACNGDINKGNIDMIMKKMESNGRSNNWIW